MKTGTDRITGETDRYIGKGSRVAVLCNQASLNSRFEHITDILLKNEIRPVYIFSPEHGLYGLFQDMVEVRELNHYRGIPVISLYGNSFESLSPDEELLKNFDTLIVDLFDIGTRFYTFAASLFLFMKKASGKNIRFIICDRPNPIGGRIAEGNGVEEQFRSFVGIEDLPVRHSLTLGELSLFFKDAAGIDIRLQIIRVSGYSRDKYLDYYTPHFVPPSPNMPSLNTAFVYPLGCLFEGTNISEGRGTTRPFEIFGADFINPKLLADELNGMKQEGVYFRPVFFMPKFHKYSDKIAGGIFIHITDRKKFRPYITGILILRTLRKLYPDKLKWRYEPYEFISDIPAIDLLFGTDKIRKMIDSLEIPSVIKDFIKTEENRIIRQIKDFYIYR
ncbi:MAG: DUF1343 domain-containing protein [Deltaproteobacteria bacterium]|nr:DUF1343 domain-containing protein [Deltaproteobacteria bacterium]